MSAVVEAREPGARYLETVQPALVRQFELLGTAPGGVARMRELILCLATTGRLVANGRDQSHWQPLTLKQVGEWGSGGTPSKSHPEYYEGGTMPWLVIGDLNDAVVTSAATCITDLGLRNSSAKVVEPGTVLIAMYGSIGKLGIAGIRCATNQAIAFCRPSANVVTGDYLFLFLRSIRASLLERGQGLAQQNISQKILKSIEISVPPLAEQARIVARVDELMRLCDALETKGRLEAEQHARLLGTLLGTLTDSSTPEELAANWQRVADHFDLLLDRPEAVDALEQTILQLAVRGLLVPRGHWTQSRFGDVVAMLNGYAFKSEWFIPSGIRLVRNVNVSHGSIDWHHAACVSPAVADEFAQFALAEGDVVLTLDRPIISTGLKLAVVEAHDLPCLLLQRVARLSPDSSVLSCEFLLLWLRSDSFMKAIDPGRSNGVPHISTKQVAALTIDLPPRAEQARIVARVTELRRLCTDLRQRLAASEATQARLAEALVEYAAA